MTNEEVGTDAVTDYLLVSSSSADYVGHLFGPSSLEMEDDLLWLNRTISKLLALVEKKVGLVNVHDLSLALQEALRRRSADTRAEGERSRLQTLSPREREVLTHVITGKLNKQIAADLEISGSRNRR